MAAPTMASGRVTAMAIDPYCGERGHGCRVWVAAAGGGIWRTDHALAGHVHWTAPTQKLPTNSFGSLYVDPNDRSGDTIYAGSGEPNGSSDSEAALGLFRSRDGGRHWQPRQGLDLGGDRPLDRHDRGQARPPERHLHRHRRRSPRVLGSRRRRSADSTERPRAGALQVDRRRPALQDLQRPPAPDPGEPEVAGERAGPLPGRRQPGRARPEQAPSRLRRGVRLRALALGERRQDLAAGLPHRRPDRLLESRRSRRHLRRPHGVRPRPRWRSHPDLPRRLLGDQHLGGLAGGSHRHQERPPLLGDGDNAGWAKLSSSQNGTNGFLSRDSVRRPVLLRQLHRQPSRAVPGRFGSAAACATGSWPHTAACCAPTGGR